MIAPIVQKALSKVGSDLGKTEVACFNKSYLPRADIAEYVQPTLSKPEEYHNVYAKVLAYTQNMIDIATTQKIIDEDKYIQPPTFELLQDVFSHLNPEVAFFTKGSTGTVEISYETSLRTNKGLVSVTGETALLICVGGVPVGNVEVKNLNLPCNTPKEIGEILAEDKGFAEQHKHRIGVEPRHFPSVLVSGQRWVFVDRRFWQGSEQYLLFPVLVTFNLEIPGSGETAAVYKIDESSVQMVSRLLMRMSLIMGKLVADIRKIRKRVYEAYAAKDEDPEDEGDEGDEFSDDDPGPPLHQKRLSARDKSAVTAVANKGVKEGGGRGGWGGGGGKKHSALSQLTMENIYRHERDTYAMATHCASVDERLIDVLHILCEDHF